MERLTAKNSKTAIFSWCWYDAANSGFPTVITTFIFAAYFTQAVAQNSTLGTHLWGNAVTISGIFIALMSPIAGTIADYYGQRKPWLIAFTSLVVLSSTMLWWVTPETSSISFALTWVILGTIGHEVANVFYNAMLHELVPENYYGRVSGWGWGAGYVGGLLCLVIALVAFVNHPQWLGLDTSQAEHVRATGPLVAIWFVVFALPLILYTPDLPKKQPLFSAIHQGLSEFGRSLKKLWQHPNLLWYLLARMIYIDGLNTIFAFGGIYAAGTFGMNATEIIQFGIAINIAAGFGAFCFAWVDDWIGPKKTITLSLLGILIFGVSILLVDTTFWFTILAFCLCLFVGPVQASSRSLLTHIVPNNMTTEVFGLYAFSGKATAFIGPWIFGVATLYFDSQRAGIGSTLIFVLIGFILLQRVKVQYQGESL